MFSFHHKEKLLFTWCPLRNLYPKFFHCLTSAKTFKVDFTIGSLHCSKENTCKYETVAQEICLLDHKKIFTVSLPLQVPMRTEQSILFITPSRTLHKFQIQVKRNLCLCLTTNFSLLHPREYKHQFGLYNRFFPTHRRKHLQNPKYISKEICLLDHNKTYTALSPLTKNTSIQTVQLVLFNTPLRTLSRLSVQSKGNFSLRHDTKTRYNTTASQTSTC